MQTKFFALLLLVIISFSAACGGGASTTPQVIQSAKAGDLTVTLSNNAGPLRHGENDLLVTFTDATGKPVDVGAASLNFHMGAMGSMAEMNDRATLTTTDTPGKYRAQVKLSMGGSWEAQIAYQGPQGTGKTAMNVQAK